MKLYKEEAELLLTDIQKAKVKDPKFNEYLSELKTMASNYKRVCCSTYPLLHSTHSSLSHLHFSLPPTSPYPPTFPFSHPLPILNKILVFPYMTSSPSLPPSLPPDTLPAASGGQISLLQAVWDHVQRGSGPVSHQPPHHHAHCGQPKTCEPSRH